MNHSIICNICNKQIINYIKHKNTQHKNMKIEELIQKNDKKYTGYCLIDGCEDVIYTTKKTINTRPYFCKKHFRGVTLEKCLIKHGNIKGNIVWKSYCEKQALSNTFIYKKIKYGWDKNQFDVYNKKRSVTLENCINKYGKTKGIDFFECYREKQKSSGVSLDYFKNKHGDLEGEKYFKELNKRKAQTLENHIIKYGKIKGTKKYLNFIKTKKVGFYSKISKELFIGICNNITFKKNYFGEKEYGIYDSINKTYYKYDFVCLDNMKIIEFNGDRFHPKHINDKSFKNPYNTSITSQYAWNRDNNKKICAELHGFEIMYIWEHEYKNNNKKTIKKCLNFLER